MPLLLLNHFCRHPPVWNIHACPHIPCQLSTHFSILRFPQKFSECSPVPPSHSLIKPPFQASPPIPEVSLVKAAIAPSAVSAQAPSPETQQAGAGTVGHFLLWEAHFWLGFEAVSSGHHLPHWLLTCSSFSDLQLCGCPFSSSSPTSPLFTLLL